MAHQAVDIGDIDLAAFVAGRPASGRRRSASRAARGAVACVAGAMAEDSVATYLAARGVQIIDRRWRGEAGEIDLVCRVEGCVIFVEVKAAPSHADAAKRLHRRQMDRICQAACEYCAALPSGQSTEMRFDVALVDSAGRVEMIENAFGDA